jgi:bifunctional DNA-binding transcriptional regulator/antitoxin component of YhaV-PrlF toxin-antitoxin module
MRMSSISSKGQLTIPRDVQLRIGLIPNSKVMMYDESNEMLMIKPMKTSVVDQTAGSLGAYVSFSKRGKDFSVIEKEMKKKAAAILAKI